MAALQASSEPRSWVNGEERDVLLPWIEAKEETKLGHSLLQLQRGHDNRALKYHSVDGKSGKSGYPWNPSGGHVIGVSTGVRNKKRCPSGKSGKSGSYTEGKSGKSGRIRPYGKGGEGKSGKSGGQVTVYKMFKKNGGGVSLFRYFMHA